MGVLRIFLPIKASLLVEILHAIGSKFWIDREKLVFRPALAGKKDAVSDEFIEDLEGSLLAHVAFRPLEEVAIDKGAFARNEDFLDVGPFADGLWENSLANSLTQNKKCRCHRHYIHCGWGDWDRTSACRIQSPKPYRLATPQGPEMIVKFLPMVNRQPIMSRRPHKDGRS